MTAFPVPHSTAAATPAGGPLTGAERSVPLPRGIQSLERALAAAEREPGWWERITAGLNELHGAFAEHVMATEGPDGYYAEVLDHAPRLARRVRVLIREHTTVAAAMTALRRRAALPGTTAEELRTCCGDLLRELTRHRQRGADLIYDAYQTDLGGET